MLAALPTASIFPSRISTTPCGIGGLFGAGWMVAPRKAMTPSAVRFAGAQAVAPSMTAARITRRNGVPELDVMDGTSEEFDCRPARSAGRAVRATSHARLYERSLFDSFPSGSSAISAAAASYCRRTISSIQIGAKGEVQPFETG